MATIAFPLKLPPTAMSNSRHTCKLASRLPATRSRSQNLISADTDTWTPTSMVLRSTWSAFKPDADSGSRRGISNGTTEEAEEASVASGGNFGGLEGPTGFTGTLKSAAGSDIGLVLQLRLCDSG